MSYIDFIQFNTGEDLDDYGEVTIHTKGCGCCASSEHGSLESKREEIIEHMKYLKSSLEDIAIELQIDLDDFMAGRQY